MGRPSRMMQSLLTGIEQRFPCESELDLPSHSLLTSEEELEQRRSELKNGLTDLQRLFLFGKLDKPSAKSGRGWSYRKRNLQSGRTFTGPTLAPSNSAKSAWELRLPMPWRALSV